MSGNGCLSCHNALVMSSSRVLDQLPLQWSVVFVLSLLIQTEDNARDAFSFGQISTYPTVMDPMTP